MSPTRVRAAARTIAVALFVATLAAPAFPVTIANTGWTIYGKASAKVKGLGKAKNDVLHDVTFFDAGDVRAVDAFERTFTGTYVEKGRRTDRIDVSLSTASTSLLEDVIEGDIEAAILAKTGETANVTVDVTTVAMKVRVNKRRTTIKLRMKAKAIGSADIDVRRRKTTYTVRAKGGAWLD
jgi:hypothetical protein